MGDGRKECKRGVNKRQRKGKENERGLYCNRRSRQSRTKRKGEKDHEGGVLLEISYYGQRLTRRVLQSFLLLF